MDEQDTDAYNYTKQIWQLEYERNPDRKALIIERLKAIDPAV